MDAADVEIPLRIQAHALGDLASRTIVLDRRAAIGNDNTDVVTAPSSDWHRVGGDRWASRRKCERGNEDASYARPVGHWLNPRMHLIC
jgi:hypothetical protein